MHFPRSIFDGVKPGQKRSHGIPRDDWFQLSAKTAAPTHGTRQYVQVVFQFFIHISEHSCSENARSARFSRLEFENEK